MQLKIYVDVFGRVALCEKFPEIEETAGLNDMLRTLVEFENFYGDLYPEKEAGFYTATFEIDSMGDDPEDDVFLQIEKIENI